MVTVELRSGSANVVVSAPNHTTVNYTANLTSDGNPVTNNRLPIAPGNGHTVHVGNVIPLFPTTGAGTATVRGRAYIETDLTNETAEQVTPGVLGAGTNLFTANININNTFRQRYLNIANASSSIGTVAGAGFEGFINRISYENATTNVVVDATGNYSGVVPATASGLPLQLRYSQIAADRTFWASSFDNANLGTVDAAGRRTGQVITRRFIYGPDLTADPVFGAGPAPTVTTNNATLTFNTQLAPATVTAAITRTGALRVGRPNWDLNNDYFILRPTASGDARFEPDPANNGLYLTSVKAFNPPTNDSYIESANPNEIQPPAVTFTPAPPGGTTATGLVVLTDNLVASADFPFKRIRGIRAINVGSGYTTAPTGTFTRRDNTSAVGNVTGTGSLQAPTDELSVIQVTDGGFGFLPQPFTSIPSVVSTVGKWTGMDPNILFGGQNPLPTPKVTPTVSYSYNNPLGTVNSISVSNGGSGLVPTDANITFSYGAGASLAPTQGVSGVNSIALFEIEPNPGSTNRLQFNFSNVGNIVGGLTAAVPYGNATAGLAANQFTFFNNSGVAVYNGTGSNVVSPGTQPYVFVPTASFSGANAVPLANAGVLPTITVSVLSKTSLAPANRGKIASLTLSGGGNAATVLSLNPGDPIPDLGIVINNPGTNQTLAAKGFLAGTGIDNYAFNVPSQNAGRFIPGFSTGASAGGVIPFYPGYYISPLGTGNRKSQSLTGGANQLDRSNHSYIAKFSTPPTAPFLPAKGYPVFDKDNRVVGLVITDAGAGYVQGSPITFEIVPNGEDAKNVSTALVPASLTFTVVNGGRFATVPDVILSGGGLTLAEQPANEGNLNSITPLTPGPNNGTKTATNGRFDFTFNSNGVITGITLNGSLPAYNNDPITVTISPARQDEALQRAWDRIPDKLPDVRNPNETYLTRSIDVNDAGAVTGVRLIEHKRSSKIDEDDYDYQIPIRFFEVKSPVTYDNITVFSDYEHFNKARFIVPPAVTFGSTGNGTGATGAVVLAQNIGGTPPPPPPPSPNIGGAIQGINVTAGGTGYRVTVPGFNRNGRIVGTYSPSGTGFARDFAILAPTDGNSGSGLTNIDAFSGVTYVRDVHYGTGAYFAVGAGR
jgi:hypothetical protein